MFKKLFGKSKQETIALTALDELNVTLESLKKKQKELEEEAAQEVEKAREFKRANNKRDALQCLKMMRLCEQQIELLGKFKLRIHEQMIMLATIVTVDALRTGAAAMKSMIKAINIDDVYKTMDEIKEHAENMKRIQEALSIPIVAAAADFDEDELKVKLEQLKGAELEARIKRL